MSLPLGSFLAYAGPALAEALAAIGSVFGTRVAASAGVDVIGEDPSLRARVYALAAFPMTQTLVYGFIFMFLSYSSFIPQIMSKHNGEIPVSIGIAILALSIFVGFAEIFSAYAQGVVCKDGIISLLKTKGRTFADAVVLAAYEELYGIIGMIFGVLMMGVFTAIA